MKLYATPLSHFSRKVRILLELFGAAYEFVDVGNVADKESTLFAGNPLRKVPIFEDGEIWLFESDHIAKYLVNKLDPGDRYNVNARDPFSLNCRAILNGLMNEEVKVVLARRTGVPTERYKFFEHSLTAIANSLAWLEKNAERFDPALPGYREFHLVCGWEHLAYYKLLPLHYERLGQIVNQVVAGVPAVRATSPFIL